MFSASVVITTKNRREDLLKAVESAMAQRGLLEVVVIDDGSTDDTARFIERIAAENGWQAATQPMSDDESLRTDFQNPNQQSLNHPLSAISYPLSTTAKPQLRLIRHEVSAGYIVRRNEGARVAKGDVIFSLDDDAVFSSPFVVEQTLRDFSHPRIGAVAIPYIEPHKANKEMQRAPTREDVWITASYIGTAHAVRRDVFLALGGYREHLVHQGEEGDFCLRMLAAELTAKQGAWSVERGAGSFEPLITQIDTDKSKDAGPCLGKPSGASESDSLASKLADSPVSESLTRSASGPALARIAPGGMGSGGGNQLADSGEFLEGQSQAGLQMDSQKLPTPRAATGSATSGENSSSVSISVIGGEKNSGAPQTLSSLDSGRVRQWNAEHIPTGSSLDSAPLSAVPGFFVRLGNSDVIIHNESPKRDYSRMDFYGRRNDVLFHWQNTPMPDLLWQLSKTIGGGVVCAAKVGRWKKMLQGIRAGFVAIAGGVKREPVSKVIIVVHKSLKSSCQKMSFC